MPSHHSLETTANVGKLGLLGAVYVILRSVGKVAGARLGMRGQDVPDHVRRELGFCLISSSSLAVGFTIQVRTAFPDLASAVTAVALAAVLIFEIVGPILTRRALLTSGEAQTTPAPLAEVTVPSLEP